jgi:hypothetical protein
MALTRRADALAGGPYWSAPFREQRHSQSSIPATDADSAHCDEAERAVQKTTAACTQPVVAGSGLHMDENPMNGALQLAAVPPHSSLVRASTTPLTTLAPPSAQESTSCQITCRTSCERSRSTCSRSRRARSTRRRSSRSPRSSPTSCSSSLGRPSALYSSYRSRLPVAWLRRGSLPGSSQLRSAGRC